MSYSGLIDGCAFHEWPSSATLLEHMDEAWGELISPRLSSYATNTHGQRIVYDPFQGPTPFLEPVHREAAGASEREDASSPYSAAAAGAVPGSDYAAFEGDVLAHPSLGRVVLGYERGLQSTSFVHRYLARDIVRAANDWTVAEWLARDDRLYGMVLVSTAIPEEAAAEVRRVGANERMVAVALGCNGLGRPFGEPAYHPILEAADELGLPIVIQVGSDIAADQTTPPVALGVPSTYGEFRAHAAQSHWGHACSLITEGVFKRFPRLRVLLVGGGATWIPGWAWRMDYSYKTVAAAYPWIERLPSEYLVDHIRISTLSLEKPPRPERLAEALGVIKGIEGMLIYTSGYPSEDWETAEQVAQRLPTEWHERVFRSNAEEFFRWPDRAPASTAGFDRGSVGG